jgi:hypothetical protein
MTLLDRSESAQIRALTPPKRGMEGSGGKVPCQVGNALAKSLPATRRQTPPEGSSSLVMKGSPVRVPGSSPGVGSLS